MPITLRAKELSWLAFNARLLQEAADPTVPLLERLRFLGIFSSNLDEFFRVRVATLKRLAKLGRKARALVGSDPERVLKRLDKTVREQQETFEAIYETLLDELEEEGILIKDESELTEEQGLFVKRYFQDEVRSTLVPIMLDQVDSFTELNDHSIYMAIALRSDNKRPKYALIEVPTAVIPRFVLLPTPGRGQHVILLDDVIRYNLLDLFSTLDVTQADAYTLKLTRDAELDLDDDVYESFIEKVSKSLQKRKAGQPVRFVFDGEMPESMRRFVIRKLKLSPEASDFSPGGRYHNFKDFMDFPNVGRADLRFKSLQPLRHPDLAGQRSIMKVIEKKDVLLHYPYQSFGYVIDLLREASIDPNVTAIQATVYRLAKQSQVINALANAAKNGKAVTVVVELQARFDEKANIRWADKLQRAGVRVLEGVQGLKVHSKLLLITRRVKGKTQRLANIGTGNFHEGTARLYSDHALLTSDPRLTGEVARVFDFITKPFEKTRFKHLLVSPFNSRDRFTRLINREIKNAVKGLPAFIVIKINNLTDPKLIGRLYKASQSGVDVRLMVRGMFSLVVGVDGISDNIQAVGIVDRFLEHSRVLIFCNNGAQEVYLSSADWMPRNLDRRIEVACPIYDERIRRELLHFVDLHWQDSVKSRLLTGNRLKNEYKEAASDRPLRAQEAVYAWLRQTLTDATSAKKRATKPRLKVAK